MINIAAIMVLDNGTKKSMKKLQAFAPSNFADPKLIRNCFIKLSKEKVAVAEATNGRIRPVYEFVKPKSDTIYSLKNSTSREQVKL